MALHVLFYKKNHDSNPTPPFVVTIESFKNEVIFLFFSCLFIGVYFFCLFIYLHDFKKSCIHLSVEG